MYRRLLVAALPAMLLLSCASQQETDTDLDVVNQILEQKDAEIADLTRELEAAQRALAAAEEDAKTSDGLMAEESSALEATLRDLSAKVERLTARVAEAEQRNAALELETRRLETDLADSLAREAEAKVLIEASLTAEQAESEAESRAAAAQASAAARLSEALRGGGGFNRVATLDFTPSRTSRLTASSANLAVDESRTTRILYDTRIDYDRTVLYLAIQNPGSPAASLSLVGQFVTDVQPIYAQTAVIAIEGLDPIDPVDPIVLAGPARRETDGVVLRESFTRNADRMMVERISEMLSSSKVTVTFVGSAGQHTHRPSVPERQAMANVLFAYIDMGGLK